MFCAWIPLFLLLTGASSFMIHNTHLSLCLEDSAAGRVLLKRCSLDSELQQWVWEGRGMLRCVGSSRCLSARQGRAVRTELCPGPQESAAQLLWDCEQGTLINLNTSLLLSTDSRRPTLSVKSQHSKWRSLDEGDICQEKLRSRRASGEAQHSQADEQMKAGLAVMTEEQRQFLQWYYRTEDPTPWKFAMLGLSFTCLLVGFLLLGMGCMASRNRKKIAKYKAAAALVHRVEAAELQVVSHVGDDEEVKSSSASNGGADELKAGNIVVTWRDGNVSNLYTDPAAEEEMLQGGEEQREEKEEEASAAELQLQERAMMME